MFRKKREDPTPDLATQFESLLDQVWDSEKDAEFFERIDRAARADEERERRAKRKPPK